MHDNGCDAVIVKLGNLSSIETASSKEATAASFLVGTTEYAVPLGNSIDVEAEIKKLEDELKYQQGFLRSVLGKLGNERFVNNAPVQVVEMERKSKPMQRAKSSRSKKASPLYENNKNDRSILKIAAASMAAALLFHK